MRTFLGQTHNTSRYGVQIDISTHGKQCLFIQNRYRFGEWDKKDTHSFELAILGFPCEFNLGVTGVPPVGFASKSI
jgi:hypothetical protein